MKKRPKYHAPWRVIMLCALVLSILPISSLCAQTGHTSIERKLAKDAARLALRDMMEKGDKRLSNICLPEEVHSEFYNLLFAVYDSGLLANSLEKCNVHTDPELPIDHIILLTKKDAQWIQPLKNRGELSGNQAVNRLIEKHELKISLVDWDDECQGVIINSEKPLNFMALVSKIQNEIPEIKVNENAPQNTSNDIRVKRISVGWEVTYLYRFGGNFGKPPKEHFWIFNYTSKTQKVEFIQGGGDELPEWVPCKN